MYSISKQVTILNFGCPLAKSGNTPVTVTGGNARWERLIFQYDRQADILYINTCEPEQESEKLEARSPHELTLRPTKSKILRVHVFYAITALGYNQRGALFSVSISYLRFF